MKKLKILIAALVFVQMQVYSQSKTKITFGGNAAYYLGINAQQKSTNPLLFLKNAQSAGLNLTLAPPKGTTRLKLAVDYIMGTNDDNAIAAYAKENKIEYTRYQFTKTNPNGFSIMASPQFMLFPKSQNKKLPLMWIDLPVGVMVSNQQTLQFFQGQTTPSKEVKSNAVSFAYSPSLIVNVVKTKKLFLNLKAGYSNFGGVSVGLNITMSDCRGAPCCKCPFAGCNSCEPVTTTPKGK